MLTSTSSAIATSRRRITSTVTGSSATATSLAAVNVDLLELADRERITRADQGARTVFLDQGRAAPGEADREGGAIEDGGVEEAVLLEIEDRAPARRRGAGVTVAVGEPGKLRPRHMEGRKRMQHHELGVRRRIGVAVAAEI